MKNLVLALSIVIGAALGGLWFTTSPTAAVHAELQMPDLDRRSSEATPSPEFLKEQASVAKYRQKIQEHPSDLRNYVLLAEVYLQESRATANHHRYVPIAEGVIGAALAKDSTFFEALVTKAGIEMTKHHFSDAHNTITRAISINPYNSGAYGVLCDANVEMGHYDAAVQAVNNMMQTRPDLRSYARASYMRELHGDDSGAASAMHLAADAGLFGTESREWALYHLATIYAKQGKLDTANFLYNGILEERPSYGYALSGRAEVKAAHKDYAGAVEDLVKALQVMPEHLFLEQLSSLYLTMGDTRSAKAMEQKVLAAFAQHEKDGWNVNRELALYLLDHELDPQQALVRAKRELDSRPENIDALDTYSWALYKNGRAKEAIPYAERAQRLRTNVPALHFHAGMIYAAVGDNTQAVRELAIATSGRSLLSASNHSMADQKLAQVRSIHSRI